VFFHKYSTQCYRVHVYCTWKSPVENDAEAVNGVTTKASVYRSTDTEDGNNKEEKRIRFIPAK